MRRAKKRKGIEAQRAKPFTPSQAIEALIGEEEQNGNQKEEKRKRERIRNPDTPDHLVASYIPHGSYGGLILNTPPGQKGNK